MLYIGTEAFSKYICNWKMEKLVHVNLRDDNLRNNNNNKFKNSKSLTKK